MSEDTPRREDLIDVDKLTDSCQVDVDHAIDVDDRMDITILPASMPATAASKRKFDQPHATSTGEDSDLLAKKARMQNDREMSEHGSGELNTFFRSRRPSSAWPNVTKTRILPSTTTMTPDAAPPVDQALVELSSPLKLPDSKNLTRSERLFSLGTHTDVRSLTISGDDEFFLFMDLRAKNSWASFNMTSPKWVAATQEYNTQLKALNSAKNHPTIAKNPRALVDMLGKIEPKILERITKNDFLCTSSAFLRP
jgi:hypothetical protein